ncbi:MAG: TrkH family potassium uptake protein [Alphaproteobacteria bacterium]|nr:TrkH family potassium uptake protein [Alphaproteobacteria bacterium]
MDLRPILYVNGLLISILVISMFLPMLADLYFGNPDWKVFLLCIVITAFFGGSLILSNASLAHKISVKQAFILISSVWLSLSLISALPFKLSAMDLSFTDSFFEAMSGITTTGSTVITGLDTAPPGILLWRAILQWLGGIGIIIMAMSVLPFLNVGGMQIFRTELSESEKVLPRTAQLASSIGLIYLFLTLMCIIAYMMSGMQTFDALAHALTTISTGGFSTYDSSFAHYENMSTEIVAIIFMVAGGLPFVLYLKAAQGNIRPMFTDTQVQGFIGMLIASITATSIYLVINNIMTPGDAVLHSAFNIISLVTGTGFANYDYGQWGGFVVALFFMLMVVGGCAGSTSCGIKIFRFQVFYAVAKVQVQKLIYPNGVFIANYNGRPIASDVPMSVMSFLFLYALSFAMLAIALSFVGLDFITAMSGAVTSISNVGPGLGEIIGPSGTFQSLPDSAKWILSFGMLIGRLEIFTVLVMLSPHFWKS